MPTWKRLCCATDFSDCSRAAMQASADLARRLDAELQLVHVHAPEPTAFMEVPAKSGEAVAAAVAAELEHTLAAWRAEAGRLAGRPVTSSLRFGDPAAGVVAAAREGDADVIVVGTHGRRGLKRLALGSVAERVAREAPCAVLVVRGTELVGRTLRDEPAAPVS